MSASRRSPRPSASSRRRSMSALFEKDGRGIRITRYGEVFLRHAGASRSRRSSRASTASRAPRPAAGPPLRIGALPTVSARIMPQAIKLFLDEQTGSPIKVVTGENLVLLEQLRVGVLDLVVGRLAAPEQMTGLSLRASLFRAGEVRRCARATRCSRRSSFDFARAPRLHDPDADARLDHPALRRAVPARPRHRRAAGRDRDRLGLFRPRPPPPVGRDLDHLRGRGRRRSGGRHARHAADRHQRDRAARSA